MNSFDLHELILEELSEIISATCKPATASHEHNDPVIQRILAQCPPLPLADGSKGNFVMTKRHENGILALAKLLGKAKHQGGDGTLLKRALEYLQVLPKYKYRPSASLSTDGVYGEHWFLERFVDRLLVCATQDAESANRIMDAVWQHIDGLMDILEGADTEHMMTFALPALLGTMEALEKSRFRYRSSDMLKADFLATRVVSASVTSSVYSAVGGDLAESSSVRLVVATYRQNGVILSGNYVLAQVLLVLRAVLESCLALQLVESGKLSWDLIEGKSPHQIWDTISQLESSQEPVSDGGDSDLESSFDRILSLSLNAYSDTHVLLMQSLSVLDREMDTKGSSKSVSELAINVWMSIEYRCLYVGTLVCLQRGKLDGVLLDNILSHVCSDYSHRLTSLTTVCFRVLVTIAAFFPDSRAQIFAATTAFITEPPTRLVADLDGTSDFVSAGHDDIDAWNAASLLVDDGAIGGEPSWLDEQRLVLPAAATLVACMKPSTSNARVVSTIHTLVNVLAVHRIGSSTALAPDATAAIDSSALDPRMLRVSRNVILVLARLALLCKDSEVSSLVVSMICASRFTSNQHLVPLVIQCLVAIATVADTTTFVDIVTAAFKQISFGRDTDSATAQSISSALAGLAKQAPNEPAIVDRFFCETLKSFVDTSLEHPSPPRFAKGEATPLSTHLPILDALVSVRGYTIDRDASAEQISLWRNFWFHMVIRGHLTEKSYVASYGKIYANLAAKSPVLVHPSSVNYLETEIEHNLVLQREQTEPRLAQMRQALGALLGAQGATVPRNAGFAQIVFLLAVYHVEMGRARTGNCTAFLKYFGNAAVVGSTLVGVFEAMAEAVIRAYVKETTSKRWSVEASLAGSRTNDTEGPSMVKAQVRELMVASCHRLEAVSNWAQHYVERILRAFPPALLDKSVVRTLLELVQLVWKSCKAEQDDQFVPVYWFTSHSLGITLQLPDSITYRKELLSRVTACAKRWLDLVGKAAPMELETLLQSYLSAPSDDDDLTYEPHIGHTLALEAGNNIRYGISSAINQTSRTATLATNASSFVYRLGQREHLRGFIDSGRGVHALKSSLSEIYAAAMAKPGMALPATGPSAREVVGKLHHATHQTIAGKRVDRELVKLLVWVPVALFDEGIMRATIFMWTTLIVERPDVEVLVMVELTIAWTWLVQQHMGLFSQRFEPKNPFAAKMSYAPSDKSARANAYSSISHALAPHTLLIEFLTQRFDSVKHLGHRNFSVVNSILFIMQVSFENVAHVTTNALARGPLFMLVRLGFKLLKVGFESSAILEAQLRDGLYRLAFRWFSLPPRWSFSGSKTSLAKEIQILIDTRHTVKGDTPVLRTTPPQTQKWMATASTAGSSLGSTPRGHSHAHGSGILHLHKRHANSKSPLNTNGTVDVHSAATSVTSFAEDDSSEHSLILSMSRDQLKQRARRNKALLLLLLENEICRMATWANPTDQRLAFFPDVSRFARDAVLTDGGWQNLALDAWVADPRLAVQLIARFSNPAVRREIKSLVCKFPGELVADPDALPLLIEQLRVSPSLDSANGMFGNLSQPLTFRELKFLLYWSPVPPITSTAYLASSYSRNPLALQYAMRALESFPVDITFFYVPQLVQALRHDQSGYVERAIVSSAQISQLFAHQIIWNMNANMYKDEDSQIPDTLKPTLDRIIDTIVGALSGQDREYYEKEFEFFGEVTGISGKLKPYIKKSKLEKKRKIDEEMAKIKVQPGVYLPSNPDGTVVDIDYKSGRPLQSHAKAPFMATFVISKPKYKDDEVQALLEEAEATMPSSEPPHTDSETSGNVSAEDKPDTGKNNTIKSSNIKHVVDPESLSDALVKARPPIHRSSTAISDAPDLIGIISHLAEKSTRTSRDIARSRSGTADRNQAPHARASSEQKANLKASTMITRLSAIFKVGDDCRQDVLALQLIAVFKNIFTACGLDLYLYPYRVVATAPGCGVIDVIPDSISRDQMGREKINSLSDYFAIKYHGVDSIQYQQARSNFVQSLAAYSVLSYLLQFKDRHNGNIMIDDQGHIVHIDFGFILDIAPGGITFESAPFKLTTEYIQVMGGSQDAQPYKLFCDLCIKSYLACRPYADQIIQIVALMLDSGLPCFKGESTLTKLRSRLQLDKTEREAAQFMADRIKDSYENKRTVMYDSFQKATNGIPY